MADQQIYKCERRRCDSTDGIFCSHQSFPDSDSRDRMKCAISEQNGRTAILITEEDEFDKIVRLLTGNVKKTIEQLMEEQRLKMLSDMHKQQRKQYRPSSHNTKQQAVVTAPPATYTKQFVTHKAVNDDKAIIAELRREMIFNEFKQRNVIRNDEIREFGIIAKSIAFA